MLFLTVQDEICDAQTFPFFLHANELYQRFNIECREVRLEAFKKGQSPYAVEIDGVCLQTWFNLAPQEMAGLIHKVKATWPLARIAYFDWFAPTDLRYAEMLTPYISAYVKKQVFVDFDKYHLPTLGDTNLTDYYSKRYGLDLPETRFVVPTEFSKKLLLGPGFEFSSRIRHLLRHPLDCKGRDIDLHARISVDGDEWYARMRAEAKQSAVALSAQFNIACDGRVSASQFASELRRSRFCFSPFGYGEVCWRDFEAMATGAVLLKPDVSHLRLANDIFRPYETYVPVAWDLSDLEQKVKYYANSHLEAQSISENALDAIKAATQSERFLAHVGRLLKMLEIECE